MALAYIKSVSTFLEQRKYIKNNIWIVRNGLASYGHGLLDGGGGYGRGLLDTCDHQ